MSTIIHPEALLYEYYHGPKIPLPLPPEPEDFDYDEDED